MPTDSSVKWQSGRAWFDRGQPARACCRAWGAVPAAGAGLPGKESDQLVSLRPFVEADRGEVAVELGAFAFEFPLNLEYPLALAVQARSLAATNISVLVKIAKMINAC
jgi:hypothetical protein